MSSKKVTSGGGKLKKPAQTKKTLKEMRLRPDKEAQVRAGAGKPFVAWKN
ncbi:MAG: hypothetical protein QOD06_843 [Candidatus Binatota bacterium]|jgi:hypothetical protein|nr:hypothetical protein [Candidatus Binatota bacterium]